MKLQQSTQILGFFGLFLVVLSEVSKTSTSLLSEKYVPYVLALTIILLSISAYLKLKSRKPKAEMNRNSYFSVIGMLVITVGIAAYYYLQVF